MSNLSQAERDKLPAAKFALPKLRLYPILDQEDVNSAVKLVGKHPEAKTGIISLAKAGGWKLPEDWTTSTHAATFGAGEVVIKRGKIFESGDYTDTHGFSLSPEELFAATVNYEPGSAVVRDAHPRPGQSYLDGKFGAVQRISVNPDKPTELVADVALAKWYADLLPEGELSVSAEWRRLDKQLIGLGVLTNPGIEDASIFAAFAKATHHTPEGQAVIQQVHDVVSRAGATCNAPAGFAAKHEVQAAQQIHDLCTQNGAQCRALAPGRRSADYPYFSETDGPERVVAGPVLFSAAATGRNRVMSKWDGFKTWVTGGMQGDPPAEAVAAFNAADPTPAASAAAASFNKEGGGMNEAEKAELAEAKRIALEERTKRIESEAAAFADAEIAAYRAYPSERDDLVIDYRQAAADDLREAATFAGEGMSRVAHLKGSHAKRPAHALTKQTENLTAEELAAFMKNPLTNPMVTPQAGAEKPMGQARHDSLMGMTELGRQVLNGANKN